MTTTKSGLSILLASALLMLSGCGSAGLNFGFKREKLDEESAQNSVEEIIPAWQEGEGPGVKQGQFSRGFTGQIYFITRGRGLPSEVHGNVRIYVFDDRGSPDEQGKPIHQFDFPPEAWKSHLTQSKLGPAYAVFIPYTRPGLTMATCALRIRYTPIVAGTDGPMDGSPIFSQMVSLNLGGTPKPTDYDTIETPELPNRATQTDLTMPEVTGRQKKPSETITQVSANGDLLGQHGVQQAGFDSPQGRQRDQGRIRQADFEADADESATKRAALGDENLDFLGNEADIPPAKPAVKTNGGLKTPKALPEENPKLRTYTIPLD